MANINSTITGSFNMMLKGVSDMKLIGYTCHSK